jgi:YD repeat-containing protein
METRNSVMPMQLRFYYNSSFKDTDYGYGRGFTLGFQKRYTLIGDELVGITSGDGRLDEYQRYGKEYQAPAGVFSTLTKNDQGLFVLTEKTGEQYIFGDTIYGRVTHIRDRYGNETLLTYKDSLLMKIVDAVGHTILFSYKNGKLEKASATFLQGSYKYEYDTKHQLRKVIDPMGNTTLYDYTRDGRLNEITDANGNKTIIGYNNAGMVSRLKTNVSDKSIRYDADKTVFIDYTVPSNQYSYYRWDGKGRAIEKVGLCCGIQSTLEYDIHDNVIKRTDGNGNSTEYTYDKFGNMLSLTDASGYTEQYTYDPEFNQVTSFVDKNGNSYQFTYNDKGALTSLSGPLGFSMRNTYDKHGWLLTSTDANNNVSSTTYNADGTIDW